MQMQTFGEFVRKKRIDLGINQEDLARRTSVGHLCLIKIEEGTTHAPKRDVLNRMARVLKLDESEKKLMFELAEKSKEEFVRIPNTPILDYIDGNASVIEALKIAREFGATKEDWKEFAQKIKNRKTGHEF